MCATRRFQPMAHSNPHWRAVEGLSMCSSLARWHRRRNMRPPAAVRCGELAPKGSPRALPEGRRREMPGQAGHDEVVRPGMTSQVKPGMTSQIRPGMTGAISVDAKFVGAGAEGLAGAEAGIGNDAGGAFRDRQRRIDTAAAAPERNLDASEGSFEPRFQPLQAAQLGLYAE